jgi:TfuA protein
MRGMGLVFRWMRRYRIADDDEVAQIMHPYSYKRLSDAMIDIRYALHQFNHMGLLTASEKTHICSRIKQRHFPDRHIDDIPQLLLGRGNAMRRDQMARCIKKGMPSVKTRDVKTILSHIRCYG